jgi:pimeloyl-ACP methyl ester carboxylesterase
LRLILLIGLALAAAALVGGGALLYTPDKQRDALEAKYAKPPSEFLAVAGLHLHFRDTGPRDAPAMLLLHGFGASLHTWESWAQALQTNHRVVRLDLPGFGLTGPDPTGDYTDARTIKVLITLMDQLGIARASIVGHSMGGRIAWTLAALHPERVDKLILIAPDGFASPGMPYDTKPNVPLMVRMLPYVLPTALLRATLRPAYGNPAALTDDLFARYRDMMLAPGVRGAIVDRMQQQILVPPEPLLRRIQAPTLLIWGEQDAMIPIGNAADYLRALPDARLHAFPGVGHLPQEEAPAQSLAVIRAFLDQPAVARSR